MLALTGVVFVGQGGHDGGGVVPRRDVVGIRAKRAGRRAVGPAGGMKKARDGGRQIAKTGKLGPGPGLAHQTRAEHDDVGFDLTQGRIIKAPGPHGLGRKGLGHHIGPTNQVEDHLAGRRLGQIQGDRQFAGVHIVEQAGVLKPRLAALKRPDGPHRVKTGGALKPHHGRAVIGQHAGRGRPGDGPHEVEDFDSGQCIGVCHVIIPRDFSSASCCWLKPSSSP